MRQHGLPHAGGAPHPQLDRNYLRIAVLDVSERPERDKTEQCRRTRVVAAVWLVRLPISHRTKRSHLHGSDLALETAVNRSTLHAADLRLATAALQGFCNGVFYYRSQGRRIRAAEHRPVIAVDLVNN